MIEHLIPGVGFVTGMKQAIELEESFAFKAAYAASIGAVQGLHVIQGLKHLGQSAFAVQKVKSAMRIFSIGRNIVPLGAAYTVVTAQVAAGEHIASGKMKGADLYTAPQRRRVQEVGFSGWNPQYRSV
jgi:multidrug transporter EmrE-like cation transporter